MFIAYLLSPVPGRYKFTGVLYLYPGFFSSFVSRGHLTLYSVWGFESLSTPRSVSFSNRMSRFDPDTENAIESGESDSSTDDEGDTSLLRFQ